MKNSYDDIFVMEDLEQETQVQENKAPKKSGGRFFLILLIILLIGYPSIINYWQREITAANQTTSISKLFTI